MEDCLIIKALTNKDTNSFEYLLDSYEKRVYGFIYNMTHNYHITEDLTQDVFVKVYRNLYKFNTEYAIKPWLFKIAYNTTLNYIRRNKRRIKEVELDEGVLDGACSNDHIEGYITREAIMKEIQSLKPDCRAIFILKIIEGLNFDEIGAMLGSTEASVKLKFYRNRKAIVEKLGKTFMEV